MHAPIPKPHARLTNLPDPLFYRGLVGSADPVPKCPEVEPGKRASPPDRHPPIGYDLVNQRSFPQTNQSAAEVIAAPYELLSEIEH
jgi:hypothetical protein